MQQLLEEFYDVAGRGTYAKKMTADLALMDSPMETLSATRIVEEPFNCGYGGKVRRKKSRFILMLILDRIG